MVDRVWAMSMSRRTKKRELDVATCQTFMRQHCLGARVRRLSRIINKIYDDAMRPHGLKGPQMTLLGIISRFGPIRSGDLEEILQIEQSTLSRNLNRMAAKGWLHVVPGDDARVQALRTTANGRQKFLQAFPAWEEAQGKAADLLGEEGVTHLRQLVEILMSRSSQG